MEENTWLFTSPPAHTHIYNIYANLNTYLFCPFSPSMSLQASGGGRGRAGGGSGGRVGEHLTRVRRGRVCLALKEERGVIGVLFRGKRKDKEENTKKSPNKIFENSFSVGIAPQANALAIALPFSCKGPGATRPACAAIRPYSRSPHQSAISSYVLVCIMSPWLSEDTC